MHTTRCDRFSLVLLLIITTGFIAIRVPLLQSRYFDPDELVYIHASWLVSKGSVPYVDFFDHHTPGLYYLAAPLFSMFHSEASFEQAQRTIVASRVFSLILSTCAFGLLVLIGKRWINTRHGLWAVFLTLCIPLVTRKGLEFRLDVPAFLCWIGTLAFLLNGLRPKKDQPVPDWTPFLWAGVCLGLGITFTQKVLFAIPGVGLGMLVWAAFDRTRILRFRILSVAMFSLGTALPLLMMWGGFALAGQGQRFFYNNFLMNAAWSVRVSPLPKLVQFFNEAWPVVLLAVGGLLAEWTNRKQPSYTPYWGALLTISLLGLLAGLWIIPVAQDQYFLLLTPLLGLLGARFVQQLEMDIPTKLKATVLCLGLFGLAYIPALSLAAQLRVTNQKLLNEIRYVMENSQPNEVVMDGFRGLGAFRPHAFYYFYLHHEIRAMIPKSAMDAFLSDLESGKVRPRIVALDQNLLALPDRFTLYVGEHYVFEPEPSVFVANPGKQQ